MAQVRSLVHGALHGHLGTGQQADDGAGRDHSSDNESGRADEKAFRRGGGGGGKALCEPLRLHTTCVDTHVPVLGGACSCAAGPDTR